MRKEKYYESEIFENLNITGEKYNDYEFVDCEFKNCNFIDVKLMRCSFLDCRFKSCHMSMIGTHMTRIRSAEFDGCFIQGVNWMEYSGSSGFALPFASFGNSKLKYNVFAEMKLSKFDFSLCDIIESTFSECNLTGANFKGCALDNTEFYHCDATGADFRDSSGYRIDIMSNKLKNARFSFPEAINLLSALGIKIE